MGWEGREGLDEARYVHVLFLSGVGVTGVLKWDVMSIKRLWVEGWRRVERMNAVVGRRSKGIRGDGGAAGFLLMKL